MFLLVRRDLPWSVRAVQVAHSAMQLLHDRDHIDNDEWGPYGPAVVLLGIPNEDELVRLAAELPGSVGFKEPDLADSLTAVAFYGEPTDTLTGLRLL